MRALMERDVAMPLHPNEDPEVQAARAANEVIQREERSGRQRLEANHHTLHNSVDEVERWRAQAAAPSLLTTWLELRAKAQESSRRYQSLYDTAMIPVQNYWRRLHQEAVQALCLALRGEAFKRNQDVLRVIDEAARAGVTLPASISVLELDTVHLDFLIGKLRENAGLTE